MESCSAIVRTGFTRLDLLERRAMKVGFVGLGMLGAPIARRIARSGFSLLGCDINPQTLATVDPGLCRRLAESAKTCGVELLDAGVSGGGPAALAGECSIFVGGDPTAFDRARPLLASYGKSVVHLGPVGRGMEAKLLNNLVSIANYGMSAAILDLGERLNFDREQLRQALMAGSAQGFALRAVPGLLRAEGAGALREVLKKDVDHARTLAPGDDVAMAALVPAAQAMLDRLGRIA